MIVVAGALYVAEAERDVYLAGCVGVVTAARRASGCIDFALSADLLDTTRINVYELWESEGALLEFRGDGPSGDQMATLQDISVVEFDAVARAR